MTGRTRRPTIMAIEGPSASGKSSLVAHLAPRLDAVPISEAYARLDPRPNLRFRSVRDLERLERVLLDEECRRWATAAALRRSGRSVLLDSGFVGPVTYTAGLVAAGYAPPALFDDVSDRALALARRGRLGAPDGTVFLRVGEAERRRRSARDPEGHPADLQAIHRPVARVEAVLYHTAIAHVLGARLRFVDGTGPVEAVARRVGALLPRVPPTPASTRAAVGLVRAVERAGHRLLGEGRDRASATVKKGTRSRPNPRR